MRGNCPLPQIKWCWVFQARGCRTRRCSISAPRVTSRWTDARRTGPAGKLEILLGLPLSSPPPMPCPWLRPQNQKEFLGQSQIANWLKYKISKYLHWQIEIFPRILFDWNSPRIEQSNCCWPNSFLFERERERWEDGDAERAEPKFIYLFSFSDHIWSLSRADV